MHFMWEYLFISKYDFEWTYTMFNPLVYSLEEVNAIKLLNLKQTFLTRPLEILVRYRTMGSRSWEGDLGYK